MPLIQPTENFPERPVTIIIGGTPFSFKTSLAITASKPLLIDGELGAERAYGRVATFRINGWSEVEAELNNGLLDPYDSVIIDTGKSVIDDHMWEYALQQNFTKNKQKTFGDVADIFKKFTAKIRNGKKDLIIVSHEKSQDKDDVRIYDLDITGSSKQLLLRQADQVGFAYKTQVKQGQNIINQTILTFNPTPSWPFCKNVAGLPDLILPDCKSPAWQGFLNREIIEPTKKAIAAMSDEQRQAIEVIAEWQAAIQAIVPDGRDMNAELTAISEAITKEVPQEHLQKQLRAYLLKHLGDIGWKYNKEAKAFEAKEGAPAVQKAMEEKQPKETPVTNAEDKPSLESQQAANPKPTTPQVHNPNKKDNPHAAPASTGGGLFDPKHD